MKDPSGRESANQVWQINDVLIDLSRNVVIHLSDEKRLEPKVAEVLAVLIENANAVVSRQALIDAVWGQAFGADQSLTNAISQLRKSLDPGGGSSGAIETVPKRGYCLTAEVAVVQQPLPLSKSERSVGFSARRAAAWAAALLVMAAAAVVFRMDRSGGDATAPPPSSADRPISDLRAFGAYQRGQQAFAVPTTDNLRKSIGLLEQAVSQDPEFAAAWAALAVAYQRAPSWLILDRDYFDLAKVAAERALSIDPKQPLAHAVLGVSFAEQDPVDYASAIAHLTEALVIDPNNAVALQWRGIAYTATGFFDEAYQDLSRCVAQHPDNGSCRGWIAFSRLCAGDTEVAFALFESAAEAGIRTHLGAFAKAYAAEERRANAILTWAWDFSGSPIDADRLYRAHTEPDFDFAAGAADFAAEYAAANGRPPDWGKPGAIDAAHTFKRYASLEAVWWYPVWWLRMHDDFLTSNARTALMREHGLFAYWDVVGPPPHCQPDPSSGYLCN